VVVLGHIESNALAAVHDAAAAVNASVALHTADELHAIEQPPLAIVLSAERGAGLAACASVRSSLRFAGTPIIAMGGGRGSLSFLELFHAGGDDIVAADAPSLTRRLRTACAVALPQESAMPGVDAHVVVAAQSSQWQTMVARAFSNAGVATKFVTSAEDAIAAARGAKAVVAAADLGPGGVLEAVRAARQAGSLTPWVVVAPPKQMPEIASAVGALGSVAVIDGFAPPENALFVANELASRSTSELRSATRVLYGTSVSFRAAGRDDDDEVGFTYNVSSNGLFVRTLAPLEAGDDVWLELCAPRSSRRLRLIGRAVWRRRFGPNENATVPAGFGVHIVEGLGSDLERWRDGCAQLERDEARRPKASRAPTFVPSIISRATV